MSRRQKGVPSSEVRGPSCPTVLDRSPARSDISSSSFNSYDVAPMSQWVTALPTPVVSVQDVGSSKKSGPRGVRSYRLAHLRFNHFSASTTKKTWEETKRVTASSETLRGSVLNTPFRIGR